VKPPQKIGEKRVFEIATGGNAAAALVQANADLAGTQSVYDVGVAHDDGCPALVSGGGLTACTCEILELHVTRLA
jgi:hypothetical protein